MSQDHRPFADLTTAARGYQGHPRQRDQRRQLFEPLIGGILCELCAMERLWGGTYMSSSILQAPMLKAQWAKLEVAAAGMGRQGDRREWRIARDIQALVRHPGQGMDLAEFPVKLAPGIASIGAAEDLAVDAAGQQNIGVCGMGGKVPDRPVGGHR
jgi:hypothetical protein